MTGSYERISNAVKETGRHGPAKGHACAVFNLIRFQLSKMTYILSRKHTPNDFAQQEGVWVQSELQVNAIEYSRYRIITTELLKMMNFLKMFKKFILQYIHFLCISTKNVDCIFFFSFILFAPVSFSSVSEQGSSSLSLILMSWVPLVRTALLTCQNTKIRERGEDIF